MAKLRIRSKTHLDLISGTIHISICPQNVEIKFDEETFKDLINKYFKIKKENEHGKLSNN
jgi:hypothetical protein